MSLSNLARRKLRTFLTILGVLIGTTSIVVMTSLGLGMQKASMDMINRSNDLTTITVYSMDGEGGRFMMMEGADSAKSTDSSAQKKKLDDDAVAEIAALPNVTLVSPVLEIPLLLRQGAYEGNLQVKGMTREALLMQEFNFGEGSLPAEGDKEFKLIVGSQCNNNFWNPKQRYSGYDMYEPPKVDFMNSSMFGIFDQDAYYRAQSGEGVKPKKYLIKTAGVLAAPTDMFLMSEKDFSCYADLDALKQELGRIFGGKAWPGQEKTKSGRPRGPLKYTSIYVRTNDIKSTKAVLEQINQLGYRGNSAVEYIDSMQKQSRMIQAVLGGIGAVSLLVAAIGIANTMMMSIYERTREIGIFKVLGCGLGNIRNIFLLESAFIGLFGGIIGIGLSFLLSHFINLANRMSSGGGMFSSGSGISYIPLWLCVSGAIFSTMIGMIAGLMPAMRAMRLSALEAIRAQ